MLPTLESFHRLSHPFPLCETKLQCLFHKYKDDKNDIEYVYKAIRSLLKVSANFPHY